MTGKGARPKVVVIGLDCVPPELLFGPWLEELPTFKAVIDAGVHGPLRSILPPITVPAWSAMMSGYNAAQLGVYGFRHRTVGTYTDRWFAYGHKLKRRRIFDTLSDAGRSVGLVGVPQTHPPRKINGFSVSGFLAGSTKERYTYPATLATEIEAAVGRYILDVDDFRSHDHRRIVDDVHTMTERRFALFRHFLKTRPLDLMMMVEMGPDRIHHALWHLMDPEHRLHEPGHPMQGAIQGYYRALDDELRRTLECVPDDAHLFIVSDHGAKAMNGGIAINEFLRRKGWLTLKDPPPVGEVRPFREEGVDWANTKAWGWGGYYGRVFLNVQGREPEGTVPAGGYEEFRQEVAAALRDEVRGPDGEALDNRVFRPEDIAEDPAGDPPDLMVYFDDLRWRSIGSVGYEGIHTVENDTGADGANHAELGIFVYRGPLVGGGGEGALPELSLLDVGPTILRLFGLPAPEGAIGRPMALVS